ncbi:MAG: hypothetical protein HYT07_04175 [Candidatus Levybacteria bacterium]|nr:hypothetical protein [Candidatus Levybacteria bacterium]
MDISLVSKNCIKLKGKKATFVVDPEEKMPMTTADAILLTGSSFDKSRVANSRIIINSQGEYEIGGSKISGVATTKGTVYRMTIDNIVIIAGRTVEFSKLDGKFTACEIVLVNADEEFNESSITAFSPKLAVFFGDKKVDAAKKLGAENTTAISKLSITSDKLPGEMQVVLLG